MRRIALRRWFLPVAIALLGAAGVAAPAVAQPSEETATVPDPHPYLERSNARDWVLQARLEIASLSRLSTRDARQFQSIQSFREWDGFNRTLRDGFRFERGVIAWPVVVRSSSAESRLQEIELDLDIDEQSGIVPTRFATGYHSGAAYALADLPSRGDVEIVRLEVDVPMSCYDTKFDEEAARKVEWPEGPWPKVAASTFQPQRFVTFDAILENNARVPDRDLVEPAVRKWLQGRDPRSMSPVDVAKTLTKGVLKDIQPRGLGFFGVENRGFASGVIGGIFARGANVTIQEGRGSPIDQSATLAAALREAGLPARLVIGRMVQLRLREPGEVLADRATVSDDGLIYPIVEFCLYDEQYNDGEGLITWIPIDLIQLRGAGVASQRIERPWRFFGTHTGLNDFLPFSYHLHPPTTVRAFNYPAFYGIATEPEGLPFSSQSLFVNEIREAKRASDVRERNRRYGRPDQPR